MQVLQDEIEAFTRRHEIPYFETSAKSGENVHEVFYHICKFLGSTVILVKGSKFNQSEA